MADDIPDQAGSVAVVTGANGGLGLETTRALSAKGGLVVIAARNLEKAEKAKYSILEENSSALLDVRKLDLGSLESVRDFSAGVHHDYQALDLLINNAGVMGTPRRETSDGFEIQFGTNHLGHFALTALLMDLLLKSKAARVVTVTSFGRLYGGRLSETDPHFKRRSYGPWRAYGQSKMANLQFALELNRRAEAAGSPLRSFGAHPGYANTDLQAASVRASSGGWSQRVFHAGVEMIGMPPRLGALPQLRAATDPHAKGGEFYGPRWTLFGPPVKRPLVGSSRSSSASRRLWEVSERETGIRLDLAS